MEKIYILYLDDELNNLNSFYAKYRHEYKIFIASSIAQARHYLETESSINIILSDQQMPDGTGVDFFESILAEYPDPIRILLTGYSDIDSVIGAINKGHVFRYLEKPWNDTEMKMTLENAFQFYFINRQLKDKNEELQKTNEELNRFAYSASHDLKAPVKSMLGILKLGKKENTIENEMLGLLESSVKKLDYFINNIIDYYKNTRSEKSISEIDFQKIINDSLEIIEQSQNSPIKNIQLVTSIKQEKPFFNDEFRMNVIIGYLLSNAIKYQKRDEPNKTITIDISTSAKNAKLKISDNGIGINQKYIEHIYKMFYRGTTQSTGSGIGLYIVKETLDKLEGKIIVHSEEDIGTTFDLEIPNESSSVK